MASKKKVKKNSLEEIDKKTIKKFADLAKKTKIATIKVR
jgi:hypothetical protein